MDDYAHAFRSGERIAAAYVEFTVNQLINWRMCKKKQMRWSKAGAHNLLQVKTADHQWPIRTVCCNSRFREGCLTVTCTNFLPSLFKCSASKLMIANGRFPVLEIHFKRTCP